MAWITHTNGCTHAVHIQQHDRSLVFLGAAPRHASLLAAMRAGGSHGMRCGLHLQRISRGLALDPATCRHKKARLQRTASGLCSLPHVGMQDHSARPESDLHAALQNNTRQYRTGVFSSPQRVRCGRQRNRSGCARYHSGARSRCHSGVSPRKPTAALSIPQRASRLPLRRLPCRRRRAST